MTLSEPGLAQRFALILGGLCDVTAARMAKPSTARQLAAAPLLMLLWSRLRRTLARFAALAAHPAAAAPPRIRAKRRSQDASDQKRLPRGVGWLVRLLPEVACFGSQLQHLLTEPEMAALLAVSPQAARLLRPLCRMLAVADPPQATMAAPMDAAPPAQRARPRQGGCSPPPWPAAQVPGSADPMSPFRPTATRSFAPA